MTAITGAQIDGIRLMILIQAIKIHINTQGKMRLTRVATPANLRQIASEFTGKVYPRSAKGLQTALADLLVVRESLVTS